MKTILTVLAIILSLSAQADIDKELANMSTAANDVLKAAETGTARESTVRACNEFSAPSAGLFDARLSGVPRESLTRIVDKNKSKDVRRLLNEIINMIYDRLPGSLSVKYKSLSEGEKQQLLERSVESIFFACYFGSEE